jgi:transposase
MTLEIERTDLGGAVGAEGARAAVALSGEANRSALISVPAAGMRPADARDPGQGERGPHSIGVCVGNEDGDDVEVVPTVASEENSGGRRSAFVGSAQQQVAHGTNGAGAEGGLEDGGVGEPSDEWRITEANRRRDILETFASLLRDGRSRSSAAKEVGVPYVTLWRWDKAYGKKGYDGLIPDTQKCGRKTIWEKLLISEEEKQQILAEMRGMNLDTDSVTTSLRVFAHSDKCRPDLAEFILNPNRSSKHKLPPSMRKAVELNLNLKNAHRGPRRLSLKGIWTPRFLDILPGDVFSSDDTTPIYAWWVPWVECKEYPFGKKVMQGQLLPVIDVGGQAVITNVLIARETSSYRASDIWHLFGHTHEEIGLPRLGWQLERGSWEANIIRGVDVEYRVESCGPHQAPEVTAERRIGGLRQLPTNITKWHEDKLQGVPFPKTLQTWTSFLPKSKSIEGWFNRSQTLEGTLWGALGRDQQRQPFEKAKKVFEACKRGAADPGLHFLSQTELLQQLNARIGYLNHEPMEGEVFKGIPMQKFERSVADYPLYQMPEELKYLYRREWTVGTVTGGWARVRLTDPAGDRYSLFYIHPEFFAEMEGKQVAIYYDRDNFEQPAQIVAASDFFVKGTRYQPGDFVCSAQYEERKGSFLSGDQSGHDIRKRWKNAVMSVYGTLVKHAPSRQLPVEIAARREEAKAVERPERKSIDRPVAPSIVTVDRRPHQAGVANAVTLPASRSSGPSAEEISQQRNDFAQQAAIAAQLRALRGED